MPGARLAKFRIGDSAELLAEFILGRLAFTTKVPRTEDVGHDLHCSMIERAGGLLKAGPFFTVQVKANRKRIKYEKPYQVRWISEQENPFFVCVVNQRSLSVDLYSTWNMLLAILWGTERIVLKPGDTNGPYPGPINNGKPYDWTIPLGKPILRISVSDAMDKQKIAEYSSVLRQWIRRDRENIVNRYAGMYWVVGPTVYETNRQYNDVGPFLFGSFYNPGNFEKCIENFGRIATALRVVMRMRIGIEEEGKPYFSDKVKDLDPVLRSYSEYLEPLARQDLRDKVGLSVE
jgi:hypothetical protein